MHVRSRHSHIHPGKQIPHQRLRKRESRNDALRRGHCFAEAIVGSYPPFATIHGKTQPHCLKGQVRGQVAADCYQRYTKRTATNNSKQMNYSHELAARGRAAGHMPDLIERWAKRLAARAWVFGTLKEPTMGHTACFITEFG